MIDYGNIVVLADGSEVYKARGEHAQGWLRTNNDHTHWTLYETLEQAVDSYSLGEKSWEYRTGFESFEEEVIEHWLETGEDVEAPDAVERDLLQVLRAAKVDMLFLKETLEEVTLEVPESTLQLLKDLDYHIQRLESSVQLSWSVEDVMMRMADPDIDVAREVLQAIKDHHNASEGVNWETIDQQLESLGYDLKEQP